MRKDLHITNFKSIEELSIGLNRINVFLGEPNSGKSNILEAVGLLSMLGYSQSKIEDFIRFERVIDLFHDQLPKDPIEIVFDGKGTKIEFTSNILRITSYDGTKFEYDMKGQFRGQKGNSDLGWYKQFKFYLFRKDVRYRQDNYEGLTPPFGNNLPSLITTKKELKRMFSELMLNFEFEPIVDPYESSLKLLKKVDDLMVILPYNVISEGLRRLVFFRAAYLSNKESVITMEEPESYLFPYYASNFAESLGLRKDDNIYIIATHNVYFLNSILEKTPRADLNVFITCMKDGSTHIKKISNSEIGDMFEEDPFHMISLMEFGE